MQFGIQKGKLSLILQPIMQKQRNHIFVKLIRTILLLGILFSGAVAIGQNNNPANEDINIRIQVYEDLLKDMEKTPAENEAMAKVLYQLGELYFATEDFSKAIDCYVKSLAIREFNFNSLQSFGLRHPWILVDIGNSLFRLGEYDYAKSIYLHAFRLFNMRSDQRGIITSLNNIGLCDLHSQRPKEAYNAFTTTMRLSYEINDSACIFISGVYRGMAYNNLGDYRNAIDVLNETRQLELNSADIELRGYLLINLASAYKNIGQKDSAFSIYNFILSDEDPTKLPYYKNEALIYSADIYYENGAYSKAESNYLKAWNQFQYIHNMLQQANVALKLYLLYKEQNQFEKALHFYEEYQKITSKIGDENMKASIIEYNQKMDQLRSNWKIKEAELKEDTARNEKESQKKLSIFLIAAALLLIIVMSSSKGFDSRINYLKDYLSSFETKQKTIWILALLLYFIAFFYFFTPFNSSLPEMERSFIAKIIPGFAAFILSGIVFYFSIQNKNSENLKKLGIKNHFFIVFAVAISLVFTFEAFYFIKEESFSLNSLLSLFLLVFTSFILPFYFGILLVEKYIMKQVENIAKSLDKDISLIKESSKPSNKEIIIESEKTNASITFQLMNLLMVEAQGNYCMFYVCENGDCENKIMHITMKAVQEKLSEHPQIIRCHKSFIANIHHVIKVSGNSRGYALHFENQEITAPVSRGYQKDVMNSIRNFKDGIL